MGPTAQALTGLTHMVGLPGREPAGWSFSYLDHVGGYLGAVGILTGLAHRRRTGEGQHVDVSQLEPATALAGPLLLDRSVNGRSARRAGLPDRQPPRRGAPGRLPGGRRRRRGRRQVGGDLVSHRARVAGLRRGHRRSAVGDRCPLRHPGRSSGPRRRARRAGRVVDRRRATATRSWTCCRRARVPAGAVQDAADRLERDPAAGGPGPLLPLGNAEVGDAAARRACPSTMSATPPQAGGRLHRRAAVHRRGRRRHPARAARAGRRRDRPRCATRGALAVSPAGHARRGAGGRAGRRAGRVLRAPAGRARRRRHRRSSRPRARPAPRGSVRRRSRGRSRRQPGLLALQRGQALGRRSTTTTSLRRLVAPPTWSSTPSGPAAAAGRGPRPRLAGRATTRR